MSKHDWLLAIFDDLQRYAEENDLPIIAEEIAKKRKIARWEIDAKAPLGPEKFCKMRGSSIAIAHHDGTMEIMRQI